MNYGWIILWVIVHGALFAQKPVVVASASMIADMVTTIGGDKVQTKCIVPIGGDPHTYDPTPGDVEKIREANLIFINGLTFEGWMNELIQNSGTKASTILVTRYVQPLQSHHYQNATDPHAWMSPQNGIRYVQAIFEALCNFLPKDSSYFQQRYLEYKQQLQELHVYTQRRLQEIPPAQRVLVTSHDAFQYFGRDYGLRLESVLGTSTDADIQVSDIIHLHKVLKSTGVKAVFVESTVNPKVLRQVASDNNVVIGGNLYADSLGDENSPASTYIRMLRHNIDTIADALTKGGVKSATSSGNAFFLLFCIGLFGLAWIFYIKLIS